MLTCSYQSWHIPFGAPLYVLCGGILLLEIFLKMSDKPIPACVNCKHMRNDFSENRCSKNFHTNRNIVTGKVNISYESCSKTRWDASNCGFYAKWFEQKPEDGFIQKIINKLNSIPRYLLLIYVIVGLWIISILWRIFL